MSGDLTIAGLIALACCSDGCVLAAVSANVIGREAPWRVSLALGLGHAILMLLGLALPELSSAFDLHLKAYFGLLGVAILLSRLIAHRHKPLPKLLFFAALLLSADAAGVGLALPELLPRRDWLELSFVALLSATFVGLLTWLACRGFSWLPKRAFAMLSSACIFMLSTFFVGMVVELLEIEAHTKIITIVLGCVLGGSLVLVRDRQEARQHSSHDCGEHHNH